MTLRIRTRLALVAALASLSVLSPAAATAHADTTLSITTPYPSIEAQPGSTVTVSLSVVSTTPEPVDLALGGLDADWTATLRGGGFVIHSITSAPDAGASADLEIDVPPTATPGEYPITVTAADGTGGRSVATISIVVAEQVDAGVKLSADFPSLSGDPGGSFAYNLSIDNDTPVEQTFTFDPTGPQGWTVTASPTAESKAQTVTIDAGANASVKVTATAPASAEQGTYPIEVMVTGANGASGTITLQAEVTGTPVLALTTADERLDVSGKANSERRIPLIVSNTGTAPLDSVKLAGTAPSGWEISFDPQQVDGVQPGDTSQVTAIVTPSSDAVAGDYAMTVRASAGSLSSNVDLRYSLEGSRTLGFVAIAVIAAAFAALTAVFVKFGRR